MTLNLAVYWLSVDSLTYPTNHATGCITRFTLLAGPFAFRNLLMRRTRKEREMILVSLFAFLAYFAFKKSVQHFALLGSLRVSSSVEETRSTTRQRVLL